MSVSQHRHDDPNASGNQNDPGDGPRGPDAKSRKGAEPVGRIPEEQRQDQSQIEAFDEEGAGIAAKE